jgi:hypothetical protein
MGMYSYFDAADLPQDKFKSYILCNTVSLLFTTMNLLAGITSLQFLHAWGPTLARLHVPRPHNHQVWFWYLVPGIVQLTYHVGVPHYMDSLEWQIPWYGARAKAKLLTTIIRTIFPHDLIKYKPEVLASDQDLFNTPVANLIAMPPIVHIQCDTIKKSITDVWCSPPSYIPPPGPTVILAILLAVPDPNAPKTYFLLTNFHQHYSAYH